MARIAIIGGGFSGTIAAYHLLGSLAGGSEIVVYEPEAAFGRGVAYADLPDHFLLNVPALLQSPLSDDPEGFLRWVEANKADRLAEFRQPDGALYVPRAWYGTYLGALLDGRRRGQRDVSLIHRRTPVIGLSDSYGRLRLESRDSDARFDAVVLALGNAPPRPLRVQAPRGGPRVIQSAWELGRLPPPSSQARIVIVGSGLTMVDAVADLVARGHRGAILCVSRHGLFHNRSAGHNPEFTPPDEPVERTMGALLRQVRRWCALSATRHGDWRPAIDYARVNAPKLWRGLPPKERARFARHVRHYWDVHRFQVPPQSDDLLRALAAAGRFTIHRGRAVEISARGLVVLRDGVRAELPCDVVINATGPDLSFRTHFASLDRLLQPLGIDATDAVRFGIEIDDEGAVVGVARPLRDRVWALGSLARQRFGELGNVGAIKKVAEALGQVLPKRLGCTRFEPAGDPPEAG